MTEKSDESDDHHRCVFCGMRTIFLNQQRQPVCLPCHVAPPVDDRNDPPVQL